MLGDERLARLVGEGNERAFNTLFSRYHQPLYRYCQSMVRHDADAQDALQSTFTSALVALRRGQRDAPLRPWLFRIAHNEAVSLLRRRRTGVELSEDITCSQASVEDMAQDRARLAQLVADLQLLPERQRSALVMRELSGLSHEDLAQALAISVGSAKQTVFEARKALQEFAEGRAMACEDIQRKLSDSDGRSLRARRVRAHLRECSTCSAFATAIPERRTALMALSPMLPAAAASGLLGKITGAGSAHHGGGGGLLAGAAGKSVGVVFSVKSLATGVAIVATAAAGTAVEIATHSARPVLSGHLVQTSNQGASISTSAKSASGAGNLAGTHAAGRNGSATSIQSAIRAGGSGTAAAHSRAGVNGSSTTGRSFTTSSHGSSGVGQGLGSSNSNAHGGNPNAGGGITNAHGGNPNAGGGNPNAGGGSSNAHGGNPNAAGGSSNAHGGNPNAGGGNPNAGGGSSNANGGNPNAGGGNPNPAGGSTNAHGGNPNAGGGNLNAAGGSTNAHGGNPNAASGTTSG